MLIQVVIHSADAIIRATKGGKIDRKIGTRCVVAEQTHIWGALDRRSNHATGQVQAELARGYTMWIRSLMASGRLVDGDPAGLQVSREIRGRDV